MLFVFMIAIMCNMHMGFALNYSQKELRQNYNYPLYSNNSCNATASNFTNCENSHTFPVHIDGKCYASDLKKGCYFVYNCICNGTVNGYQFKGYYNDQCEGPDVAIHTVAVDKCQPDHTACDGPNDPPDGYFINFTTVQFQICCPQCNNMT
eukprot:UN10376